jgi:hypothetical protein
MSLVFISCKNVFADDGNMLKVKGLYIGMSIDDANSVLNNLGYSFQVTEVEGGYQIGVCGPDADSLCIFANQNKVVYRIVLQDKVLDKLFNTSDLPMKEFARRFMDNYNIPSMDLVLYDNGGAYWRYISPYGYKVEIYDDRQLIIEAMTKAIDTKFD